MQENKNIVVVTHGYPNVVTPTSRTFVRELIEKWRSMDIDVKVIRPVTVKNYLKLKRKGKDAKYNPNDYFPLYFDFFPLRAFRFTRRLQAYLSDKSFERAILKSHLVDKNSIIYCHFLNAAYCGVAVAEKMGVECYCAIGESSFWTIEDKNINKVRERLSKVKAFVSVSSERKEDAIAMYLAPENKIFVLPNGVDQESFFQLDKRKCREELNFRQDDLIGVFLGAFSERKGIGRVDEAVKNIPNVKMVYIGSGAITPENNVLAYMRVEHSEVSKYLSAADFFVLPTLAEGCSNAIVEAMVCGLPIISSNKDFNKDILDENCALLVNPESIEEIKNAIELLVKDGSLRGKLGNNAKEKSKSLDLTHRAKAILAIMGFEA